MPRLYGKMAWRMAALPYRASDKPIKWCGKKRQPLPDMGASASIAVGLEQIPAILLILACPLARRKQPGLAFALAELLLEHLSRP